MKELSKKTRIIEVIEFEDDLNLLEHHLKNVYEHVFQLVFIINQNFQNFSKLNKSISKWVDKIKFLEIDENIFSENTISKLVNLLNSLEISFDDVVCFSKINEVPNFSEFLSVEENLKFHPVILRMTDFVYNTKTFSKQCHMGTICFQFSLILSKPNFPQKVSEMKNAIVGKTFNVVDNGWNFNFFSPSEIILQNFRRKNIEINEDQLKNCFFKNYHPNFFETNVHIYLSDYEGQIDFDVLNLNEYFHNSEGSVKNLVILNFNQMKIPENFSTEYDRVFNFNFGNNYSLPEVLDYENLRTINIFFPNFPLYKTNDSKTFEFVYVTNEIKRVLLKSNLMNNDSIDIISLPKYFDDFTKKSMEWRDFKTTTLKQTFNEIF